MRGNFALVGIVAIYLLLGIIASETGLTEPVFDVTAIAPDNPDSGGSWWDKVSAILAPLGWMFNAIAALFQMATYSADDIPPLINTFIFAPLGLLIVFAGLKMIRGGGDS